MSIKESIWDKSNGRCWYCGVVMNRIGRKGERDATIDFTIDHVIALSSGGVDRIFNLVPCCRSCNARKNNRGVEYLRWALRWQANMTEETPQFTVEQLVWLIPRFYHNMPEYIFYYEHEQGQPE